MGPLPVALLLSAPLVLRSYASATVAQSSCWLKWSGFRQQRPPAGECRARPMSGHGRSRLAIACSKQVDWLEEVRRKHFEIRQLLKEKEGDVLQEMLGKSAPVGGWRVARALKRATQERVSKLSVIAEIKRKTPTGGDSGPVDMASITDVGAAARQVCRVYFDPLRLPGVTIFNTRSVMQLAEVGADVLMVATDGPCYGGSMHELAAARDAVKDLPNGGPPIVAKDLFVHPAQVAQAVRHGADAVYLITTLLGASLDEMLDTCSCLGCEALVEVHTVNELEKALVSGATNIVASNWDRIENQLYPDQALALRHMIPDLIVSIAAGGISSVVDAAQAGDLGYDSVIVGRGLVTAADVKRLISGIRDREGMPGMATEAGLMAQEQESSRAAGPRL